MDDVRRQRTNALYAHLHDVRSSFVRLKRNIYKNKESPMCTNSQREKKKRKKKVRKKRKAKKSKISPEGTDVAALRKSLLLIKKDETWKRSEIRFRSQINSLFRIYLKTTLFERNEKNVFSRRWPAKTHENTRRGKSCSVVSPTVLNHHRHHHHHHLTRRGGREREEAIRWRDKKREREK